MNNTVPRNPRVLVVNDDPSALAANLKSWGALGHCATGVRSADAAQARYIEGSFDVLMLDVRLPALSSVNFVESLNAQSGLKVIFATGCVRTEKLAPGTAWLQKPFGLPSLESALRGTTCMS